MDEFMLAYLTFCRPGMGGGMGFGDGVGSAAKQERNFKTKILKINGESRKSEKRRHK